MQTKAQIKGAVLVAVGTLREAAGALRARVDYIERNVVSNSGLKDDLTRLERSISELETAANDIPGEAEIPEAEATPSNETPAVPMESIALPGDEGVLTLDTTAESADNNGETSGESSTRRKR